MICIQGQPVEAVDTFTYLRNVLENDLLVGKDVRSRIVKASLIKIWTS